MQRQARLAHTAWAGQRDELNVRARQQGMNYGGFRRAADKRGLRAGKAIEVRGFEGHGFP
jgi:hypothetical protein